MNRSTLVRNFIDRMIERELTIAFAESMTCGLAAHQLSTCKGTADVMIGSIVCYTPRMKRQILGVPKRLIRRYSAESREVTESMARRLAKRVSADIHAAVTGLAAPGGSETTGKPVGTVFFAVRYNNKIHHRRLQYRGTPLEIRQKTVLDLYKFIEKLTR
jgi:nicotinamide-nucleotide amidase